MAEASHIHKACLLNIMFHFFLNDNENDIFHGLHIFVFVPHAHFLLCMHNLSDIWLRCLNYFSLSYFLVCPCLLVSGKCSDQLCRMHSLDVCKLLLLLEYFVVLVGHLVTQNLEANHCHEATAHQKCNSDLKK